MSDKKRILFVDDEPKVLQGLQRMLRSMRHEWEMFFAGSGQEALEKLSNSPVDVVISDMRMPGMDGAQLLNIVRQRYSHIVRFILSGHSDQQLIFKSVGNTHQYLSKPCDAEKLKTTITRAFALRNILKDENLKELVTQLKSLPSLPTIYFKLMQELQSPDVTMTKIGEIIAKDVGMTANILQLVNSAFFGLQVHISSPVQAAKLLGLEIINALVLSVQIFREFDQNKTPNISIHKLLNHSLCVSSFAQKLSLTEKQEQKMNDEAFIAGMLHDVGKLILAESLSKEYSQIQQLSQDENITILEAEMQLFGATHAEVGAYLLGLWGLSDPIVEAVAFHHCPVTCFEKKFSPLTAVHVANALDNAMEAEVTESDSILIDREYLSHLGLLNQLPIWHENYRKSNQERVSHE